MTQRTIVAHFFLLNCRACQKTDCIFVNWIINWCVFVLIVCQKSARMYVVQQSECECLFLEVFLRLATCPNFVLHKTRTYCTCYISISCNYRIRIPHDKIFQVIFGSVALSLFYESVIEFNMSLYKYQYYRDTKYAIYGFMCWVVVILQTKPCFFLKKMVLIESNKKNFQQINESRKKSF